MFFLGHRDGSSWTPVSPVLASATHPSQPLIPLAYLWTLLNILQHIHDIFMMDPALRSYIPHISFVDLKKQRLWPTTLIPLVLVFMLRSWGSKGADVAQIAWWSISPVVAGLCYVVEKWVEDGRQDLDRLEKLKYEAKGA